jgi:hypothetical protein
MGWISSSCYCSSPRLRAASLAEAGDHAVSRHTDPAVPALQARIQTPPASLLRASHSIWPEVDHHRI